MKIDKSLYDDFAILTLKGDFDTFYCPKLQEEVEALLGDGTTNLILNLRLVKFINSTALGAIIKAFKRCKAEGGQLVLSHPSPFARDVIRKLGIDQLVPMFDDDETAKQKVLGDVEATPGGEALAPDEGKVLITFPDDVRAQQANPDRRRFVNQLQNTIVATMLNVNAERLTFSWSGRRNGLSQDQARQLFLKDSDLAVKFQVKLFKKGYFELDATVVDCQANDEDEVKVTVHFREVSESDAEALRQFAADMEYLKTQLPGS